MIKILLVALAINLIFVFNTHEWAETAGIAAAVLLAVLISTLSESGAQSAFRRLKEEAERLKCRVVRSGITSEIPADEIVVGDCILLQAGDRIPADGVLIQGKLDIDQSAINGESKEARKAAGDTCLSAAVTVAGEGYMRVTAVGDKTVYGQIAGEIQDETIICPLKERLSGLAKTISLFGYIGAALAALAYLFNVIVLDNNFDIELILPVLRDPVYITEKLLRAATLAVTVIVVAVPEGRILLVQCIAMRLNNSCIAKKNVIYCV
jgi:magnesium-transporting ATPase (P-type)